MARGGRPLKFQTVDELQAAVDKYFLECEGVILRENDGSVVYDKKGLPVIVGERPPTVTGLALALGFNSRQTLLNYQGRPQFMDTITRAKARCEEYAERRLFDKDGANGAKFSLMNNFKGWRDKQVEGASEVNQTEDDALTESLKELARGL